jgi:hypothetical protein
MIKSASEDYGYEKDDILTDVISSFCVFGCSIGEIAGVLTDLKMLLLLGQELLFCQGLFSQSEQEFYHHHHP